MTNNLPIWKIMIFKITPSPLLSSHAKPTSIGLLTDRWNTAAEDSICMHATLHTFRQQYGAIEAIHTGSEPSLNGKKLVIVAVGVPGNIDYERTIGQFLKQWAKLPQKPVLLFSSATPTLTQQAIAHWLQSHPLPEGTQLAIGVSNVDLHNAAQLNNAVKHELAKFHELSDVLHPTEAARPATRSVAAFTR
jgi:hypothetical protein